MPAEKPSAARSNRRGAYYEARTLKWLQDLGWQTKKVTTYRWLRFKDKKTGKEVMVPQKTDLLGADIIAWSPRRMVYINSKLNRIGSGRKKLLKWGLPNIIELWVIIWKPRARFPRVVDARTGKEAEDVDP